jgi:glutathione S-transferase
MKLLWSSRSPFARKVMIAAHELGVADRIETVRVVVDAANPNPDVTRHNPLGRIPTLILDDSTVLQDSVVIVEYLNSAFGGSLIPPAGTARWKVLTLQSLADGLMEADVRWLEEKRRPPAEQREPIIAGMKRKIDGALDLLEKEPPTDITVGSIAVASALAHLDFRFPEAAWRPGRARLEGWYKEFAQRPSMRATEFADVY